VDLSYSHLYHHLDRLSFLLDTTSLSLGTRRQWVREELRLILAQLEHSEAPSRAAFLNYLKLLLPASEIDDMLATALPAAPSAASLF
jgi:hypothetical protein